MDRKNIGKSNFVLDQVTKCIIATIEPYGLKWDYVSYVCFRDSANEFGELFVFHDGKPIGFKSSALLKTLYDFFQDYKSIIHPGIDADSTTVKYVIRRADLRVDTKTDGLNVKKWSSQNADAPSNPFNLLVSEIKW